jgi:hypothetical protein
MRDLLAGMKVLATLIVLALLAPFAPANAGEYTWANRPQVVFPGPKGGIVHVSPYPAGARAAAVWASDLCWNACTSKCNWRMEACLGGMGADACRPRLDACDRACLRSCRTRGGPWLGLIDFEW